MVTLPSHKIQVPHLLTLVIDARHPQVACTNEGLAS